MIFFVTNQPNFSKFLQTQILLKYINFLLIETKLHQLSIFFSHSVEL